MSKKEDNIKLLIEKTRRGDVRELQLLNRVFSKWLLSSFAEELSQSSVLRLIQSFLHNLNKLVQKIEKTENIYQKTKAVQVLSHFMETIYNTADSETAIKYIERIHEDQTGTRSLADIIGLLGEPPQQTAVEKPPVYYKKSASTRKKRAGCNGSSSALPAHQELHKKEKREKTKAIKRKKTAKKKKTEKESAVTFRAHWPKHTMPELSTDLLVYLYSGLPGEKRVDIDLAKRIKQPEKLEFDETKEAVYLKKGTSVIIRPEMPNFLFNPSEMKVTWYKDFVPVVFSMQPLFEGPFPQRGEKIHGQVSFFVGPLQIAEIKFNVIIKRQLSGDEIDEESRNVSPAYQKIFLSYAREDFKNVDLIEDVFLATGDEYKREIRILRSSEKWEPRILELIEEADVFQLFWSKAAKKSPYVEREWREALKQKKKNFIRPFYWEKPIPKPPLELMNIHFTYLKF